MNIAASTSTPVGAYTITVSGTGGGIARTTSFTLTVTSTSPPPSAGGLVASYSFNEGSGTTSADKSGNGHTANLVGGSSWAAGPFGSALSFNGSSGYATTGLTTNLSAWTISGWVRSPAAPNNSNNSGPIHRQTNYQINWNHSDPAFRGAAGVRVGTSWFAASFGSLGANTWYYLAATYDEQTLKAYTNGVLVTSNAAPSGPPVAYSNPLAIGRHAATNQFFQGLVDNVRIYSRALTQAEIQQDMNTGL